MEWQEKFNKNIHVREEVMKVWIGMIVSCAESKEDQGLFLDLVFLSKNIYLLSIVVFNFSKIHKIL
jgi:hypothetical protein